MNKPTILIVEDSEPTRLHLEKAIAQGKLFNVIASVGNYITAVEAIQNLSPDILLTDLDLPDGNGVDLIMLFRSTAIDKGLAIVISVFADSTHVMEALKAGASGYLLKGDDYININSAISKMLEGGVPISPSIARYLLDELALSPIKRVMSSNKKRLLTPRETEVLKLVSKGYTLKEVAVLLEVSPHTIKDHISHIYQKLAVNNKMQAVHEATAQGII